MSDPIAAVRLQAFNTRTQAIATEMAENVLRAAHSTFIKETWDIASLLLTREGEVFACSKDIAAKRLGMNLVAALRLVGEGKPGDVFISNDPVSTGGLVTHLPDMFLWTPIYDKEVLICFALVFVHVSDIGGIAPGSIAPSASELYQEGLRLPPVRLYRSGEVVPEIRDIVLTNSRIPNQVWGDLTAAVGALRVAERRVGEMLERTTASGFIEDAERIICLAEARARSLIDEIPDGEYVFTDYVDGLPEMDPIRITLRLVIAGSQVTMDFTGTDDQVRAAYNLYSHSQDGHWGLARAFTDYFQTIDHQIPWNSGLVRPIKVRAPEGTVLNPHEGASCGARVVTYFRVYYMVFGALANALPNHMPASGPAATGVMLVASNASNSGERRINVGQAVFGGGGARVHSDGFDGNEMVSWYLRNVPIEILEEEMDVRFLEYGLAPDSAGAGEYRGGCGTVVSLQLTSAESTVTVRGLQRHQFRAWGISGGCAGARGSVVVNPGSGDERRLPYVDVLRLKRDDVIRVVTAGGGGWGDPLRRSVRNVERDLRFGLVSESAAAEVYGVVVHNGRIDEDATNIRRSKSWSPPNGVDFGPERRAYEATALDTRVAGGDRVPILTN